MIPFDDLHRQNHDIAELSKILGVLIQDREMCDTTITCELFERYTEKVRHHLEMEDRVLYSGLLAHPDNTVNTCAKRFLNGAMEIKRIFNAYTSKWCSKGLHVYNHDTFLSETLEIFRLIRERSQAETEELYPLVRRVEEEQLAKSA